MIRTVTLTAHIELPDDATQEDAEQIIAQSLTDERITLAEAQRPVTLQR